MLLVVLELRAIAAAAAIGELEVLADLVDAGALDLARGSSPRWVAADITAVAIGELEVLADLVDVHALELGLALVSGHHRGDDRRARDPERPGRRRPLARLSVARWSPIAALVPGEVDRLVFFGVAAAAEPNFTVRTAHRRGIA